MIKNIQCLILFMAMGFFLSAQNSEFLEQLLTKHADQLGKPALETNKYRLQIIYTQIDRDESNQPHFTTQSFSAWEGSYFYPASTVKMLTAFVALEKINELGIENLDENTPMLIEAGSKPQSGALYDLSSSNKLPSIAHYIKKIFLVSDNDAFNRLYEFLGQRDLNERLWEKGLSDCRIIHRLSAPEFDLYSNRKVNPVSFIQDNQLLYYRAESTSRIEPILHNARLRNLHQGIGYLKKGEYIEERFDFSIRNYASLMNLHQGLKTFLFPQSEPVHLRFNLTDSQRKFLLKAMSMRPRESNFPDYDPEIYPDSYVKYFIYGSEEDRIPDHIRILNKVGMAYGYLTDVAYIIDLENKVEFLLSATVYTNENQIFNDNEYEYEEIGLPFLRELGKILYEYELERPRDHRPDLSNFNLDYD